MADSDKNSQEVIPEEAKKATTEEEQVVAGEVEQGEGEGDKPSYEELVAALAEAQELAEKSRDQMLRGQAELDNARKRMEREVENARKYALEKFVTELLPVKDSLELGHDAAGVDGADLAKVREGVELTLKMFIDTLDKFGVKEINPVGETFNPELHQAMTMQDVPDAKPNTVINVFQKGVSLNERLVRPAMVVVAGPNSGGDADDEPPSSSKIDEMA